MSNIISKDINWFYERVEGSKELFGLKTFSEIFNNGCYIAGGFIRKLYRDRTTKNIANYFQSGSDIDIFARDETSFNLCFKDKGRRWRPSLHSFAFNDSNGLTNSSDLDVFCKLIGFNEAGLSRSFTTQLVKCNMASPKEMLETFDLVNCQFAIDGQQIYFNLEAPELEDKRVLKVFKMNDLLGTRIRKYQKRHGYDLIDESSKQIIYDWLVWRESIHNPFNDLYTITSTDVSIGPRKVVNFHHVAAGLITTCDLMTVEQLNTLIGKYTIAEDVYDYSSIKRLADDDSKRAIQRFLNRSFQVDSATSMLNKHIKRDHSAGDLVRVHPRAGWYPGTGQVEGILMSESMRENKKIWKMITTSGDMIDIFDIAIEQVVEKA